MEVSFREESQIIQDMENKTWEEKMDGIKTVTAEGKKTVMGH